MMSVKNLSMICYLAEVQLHVYNDNVHLRNIYVGYLFEKMEETIVWILNAHKQ